MKTVCFNSKQRAVEFRARQTRNRPPCLRVKPARASATLLEAEDGSWYVKIVNANERKVLAKLRGKRNVAQVLKFSRSARSTIPPRTRGLRAGSSYAFLKSAGKTLDKWVARSRRTPFWTQQRVTRFRRDMTRAFRTLARAGYEHNDIYARNVAYDGTKFTLIDFGKVRNVQPDSVPYSLNLAMKRIVK